MRRGTVPSSVPPIRRPNRSTVVVAALVLVVVAGSVAVGALTGLRLMVIESPSMGRAAPVGTLVVDLPAAAADLHVGDVVSYRAPVPGGTLYTHRIVARVPGGFQTRGDINGARDPWTVGPRSIVGRAVLLLPGAGWLARAVQVVVPLLALVVVVTRRIRRRDVREAARMVAASLLLAGTVWVLRPLAGYVLLDTTPTAYGSSMTLVSTGVLPIRVSASTGAAIDLVDGTVGHLALRHHGGPVTVSSSLHLDALGWALVVLVSAAPAIWAVASELRRGGGARVSAA